MYAHQQFDLSTLAVTALFDVPNISAGIELLSANLPPTLDPINDLTINEDAALQTVNLIGITAGGNESQPLRVTATSSNPALIPTPSTSYTSPNSTGSISFAPLPDQWGESIITVTVEDGGSDNDLSTTSDNASFSRSFKLTVESINDAPFIGLIEDTLIDRASSEHVVHLKGINAGRFESQPLRVTATSDNVALIPNPLVDYSSPDSSGFLRLTLLSNEFGE